MTIKLKGAPFGKPAFADGSSLEESDITEDDVQPKQKIIGGVTIKAKKSLTLK